MPAKRSHLRSTIPWRTCAAFGACLLLALAFALAAPAARAAVDYGVTATPGASEKDLNRMQEAGVDVLRLGIDWGKVQRGKPGRYDWKRIDDVVLGAARRGIEVMPLIYGMPGRGAHQGKRHPLGLPDSGRELRAWRRFVRAAMERYGTSGSIWRKEASDPAPAAAISTWQVSFRPPAGASAGSPRRGRKALANGYAGLLGSARRVAEDTDRGAEIAADLEVVRSPGGASLGAGEELIRRLASLSAVRNSSATITLRPRGRPGAGLEHDVARLREALARAGLADARLILAPIGWASDKRLSKSMSVGRRKQATLLRDSFEVIDRNRAEWGVQSVIWSAWRDRARDPACDWCRKSGLMDRRGRPKPSYKVFKAIAGERDAQRVDEAPGSVPGQLTDEFFGIQPQVAITDADTRDMAAAGVGTVRLVIYWQAVQPGGQGPMRWGDYDRLFEQYAESGIKPLPVLLGSRERADELVASGLPRWREFVAAAVDRYGPGGAFWRSFSAEHPTVPPRHPDYWQVWNEQNSKGFWRPEVSPQDYASLLSASAEAIRAEDPSAKVMLGGMYGYSNMNADDFLRALYEVPGAANDFDVVAANPYGANNAPIARQIDALRLEMELAGDGLTEMWITETGWGSEPIDDPNYQHLTLTERGQADALDAAFRMYVDNRLEWRLRGVVWYSWRDSTEAGCIFCQHTGLLRNDGSAKPSLAAFKAFASP